MPDFESLYTAEEMRAAEAGHDVRELMEHAGALAAEAASQEMHGAARWTVVCGGGANRGDRRIPARLLQAKGQQVPVLGAEGEARLAEHAVTVRCLVEEDGSVPSADDAPGNVAVVARAY